MELHHKIKKIIDDSNLTQAEFGELFGLTDGAISQYCSGIRKPKHDTLKAICDKFNVSYDWLYGNSPYMYTTLNLRELNKIKLADFEEIIEFVENEDTKHMMSAVYDACRMGITGEELLNIVRALKPVLGKADKTHTD